MTHCWMTVAIPMEAARAAATRAALRAMGHPAERRT